MLPSELLITRTKKDRIHPDFLQVDAEQLELAEELISVYQQFVGTKKGELNDFMEEFEQGLEFKRIRGLRTLLERRCTFVSKHVVAPVEARRAVFHAANAQNVTSQAERIVVITAVAGELNVSASDLEQSLWADLDAEVFLEQFEPLRPEELLRWYNLSLAQTLLFRATGMTLTIMDRTPALFRAIKYFGLMYLPEGGQKIRIEGAPSLLKLSERYGTALAKLLPLIVRSGNWALDAEIVVRRENTPRIYHFLLDSRDKHVVTSDEGKGEEVTTTFDSSVEQKFYTEFVSLPIAQRWELVREPDVIVTKGGVLIPDFKFVHKELSLETYFEIVGFWTEEYLKRKLAKIRALPFTMLVAIDKSLACFNFEPFGFGLEQPLILYSKKVPVGEVVQYLTALEREAVTKQVASLKEQAIELTGDIIPIKDLAKRYGMGQDTVRASMKDPEYVVFKEVFAKQKLLRKVKEKLVAVEKYVEARNIIEEAGLRNADEVLAHFGFRVQWKGLDPGAATITLQ